MEIVHDLPAWLLFLLREIREFHLHKQKCRTSRNVSEHLWKSESNKNNGFQWFSMVMIFTLKLEVSLPPMAPHDTCQAGAKAKIRMVTKVTKVTTTGIVAAAAETEGTTGGDSRGRGRLDLPKPWPLCGPNYRKNGLLVKVTQFEITNLPKKNVHWIQVEKYESLPWILFKTYQKEDTFAHLVAAMGFPWPQEGPWGPWRARPASRSLAFEALNFSAETAAGRGVPHFHWRSLGITEVFPNVWYAWYIYTMIWDHLRYFKIKKPFWDHRSTGMLPFNVFVCFPCYVINEELCKANNKPVQIGVYYRIPLLGMRQIVNMTSRWFLN